MFQLARLTLKLEKIRGSEGRKRGTMTDFPVGSRTTVPEQTQEGLTSGFGMGPGKHLRCDRAPNFLRIGNW